MTPTRDIARAVGCGEQLLLALYRQGKLPAPTLVKACRAGSTTPYYRRVWPEGTEEIVRAEHLARKALRAEQAERRSTRGRKGSIVVHREVCTFGLTVRDTPTGPERPRPCTMRADGHCDACRAQSVAPAGYRSFVGNGYETVEAYGLRRAHPGSAGGA